MVCYTSGFFVSMLGGASLSWRMATLSYNTTSLLSLTMLLFCKESPSWLLRKGKEQEALASLFFYRGDMDMAKQELARIEENIAVNTETEKQRTKSGMEKLKLTIRRLASPQF